MVKDHLTTKGQIRVWLEVCLTPDHCPLLPCFPEFEYTSSLPPYVDYFTHRPCGYKRFFANFPVMSLCKETAVFTLQLSSFCYVSLKKLINRALVQITLVVINFPGLWNNINYPPLVWLEMASTWRYSLRCIFEPSFPRWNQQFSGNPGEKKCHPITFLNPLQSLEEKMGVWVTAMLRKYTPCVTPCLEA